MASAGQYFENRSVAIFGVGNSGMETADDAIPYAQFVHVFPGRKKINSNDGSTRPFVAWETRYSGDVRAMNAQFLDAYLLKSLDGGIGGTFCEPTQHIQPAHSVARPSL